MKAAFAAAVAILSMGTATAAIADGDDSGSGMPVVASDSAGPGDGWGVASSAGLTYQQSSDPASGLPITVSDGDSVSQDYQFLDANVVEFTQLVSGGQAVTLSGVMLQRDGGDSDPALLDEEASGVYGSGSALPVPSLYEAVATTASAVGVDSSCDSVCGLSGQSTSSAQADVSASSSSDSSFGRTFAFPGSGYFGSAVYVPTVPPPIIIPLGNTGDNGDTGNIDGAGGGQPEPPIVTGGQPGGLGAPIDVPEPAVWTIMLVGFGAVGVARRRTRRTSQSA